MITYAQEITVTGKVTAGGEEMPGVTVAVKGQTRGTITSIDGSYQIQVNGNESLIFSFEEFYKLKYCSTVVYMVSRA